MPGFFSFCTISCQVVWQQNIAKPLPHKGFSRFLSLETQPSIQPYLSDSPHRMPLLYQYLLHQKPDKPCPARIPAISPFLYLNSRFNHRFNCRLFSLLTIPPPPIILSSGIENGAIAPKWRKITR